MSWMIKDEIRCASIGGVVIPTASPYGMFLRGLYGLITDRDQSNHHGNYSGMITKVKSK